MTLTVPILASVGETVTVEVYLEDPLGNFSGFCLISFGTTYVIPLTDVSPNSLGQVVCSASFIIEEGCPDNAEVSLSMADGVFIQGIAVATT